MNGEDITRMAQEAGIKGPLPARQGFRMFASPYRLQRFATLVAAAEREKLAAWMMSQGYATGHGDTVEDLLKELEWQIEERIRNEREACAKVCEDIDTEYEGEDVLATWCAAAIRARGQV
jgi:hypothetical protein